MLEVLFGSKNAERVLQFLLARNNAYAREIALFYDVSPSVIKKQLEKFETGSIIVGRDIGNIRIYELNQRRILSDTAKNYISIVRVYGNISSHYSDSVICKEEAIAIASSLLNVIDEIYEKNLLGNSKLI